MTRKLNRKCVRCGIIQESDWMHYNKQMGWLCNNRRECTERLLIRGKANPIMGMKKMNEKEYQEKIDSLAKQKKELQKGIELIDTEKSILTIKYLYKSRKKFSGRYFKVDDAQSNWFVYYKVLKYTQDNKFLVERFQLKSIKFELEKTIIPIDLLNEKLEIKKETYDSMKEYLIEEAESADVEIL